MTPIERVSIKSQALAVLGLNNTTASLEDIKAAYRARVREKHPDRCDGSSVDFMRISEAYEFLCGNLPNFDPTPPANDNRAKPMRPVSRTPRPTMDFSPKQRTRSQTMSRPVSKPVVQSIRTRLSDSALSACSAVLNGEEGLLATHQERSGRKVTYEVPVRLLSIINRVVVPTGDLVDTRRIKATTLLINASDIKDGTYRVPSDVLEAQFPGARSVEIRFIANL